MSITFDHTRDGRYARQLLAVTSRRNRVVMVAVGALLTLAGLAAYPAEPGWRTICATVALGIGICWMIKYFVMPWQLVRRLPAVWFSPRAYRVGADGLEWSSPTARSWLSWEVVDRVTTEPFAYLLWQSGGLGMWDLPRTTLTPDQDRDLAALLAAQVGRAPVPAGHGPGEQAAAEEPVTETDAVPAAIRPPLP